MARRDRGRPRPRAAPGGGAGLSLRERVAALTGAPPERIERLAGGDLSEVLLVRRESGAPAVAKSSAAVAAEAKMLRALAAGGVPVPGVEGEYGDVLLIDFVEGDEAFSPRAWADIGGHVRQMHAHRAEEYGWPVDYAFGTVLLDNRQGTDWPTFWAEQRLIAAASLLDRPWRERVDALAARLSQWLPAAPPPALLHGDLWPGNILVKDGRLAALIDPACYHGDAEVDLAMLCLFGAPEEAFWDAYGPLEPGWEERQPIYQLFPALVHMRLFGASYAALTDRLLTAVQA
ncbi:MAG TPA: fructosamine kinase family protein [Allosphingosinicella sp.]